MRTGGTAVIPISYKSGLLWGTGEAGSYMTQRMYLALETDFWRHLLLWLRCLRVFLVAGAGTRRRRGQRGSVNPSGRVGKLGTHTPAHTLHTQLPKQVALKAVLRRGPRGHGSTATRVVVLVDGESGQGFIGRSENKMLGRRQCTGPRRGRGSDTQTPNLTQMRSDTAISLNLCSYPLFSTANSIALNKGLCILLCGHILGG